MRWVSHASRADVTAKMWGQPRGAHPISTSKPCRWPPYRLVPNPIAMHTACAYGFLWILRAKPQIMSCGLSSRGCALYLPARLHENERGAPSVRQRF